jgi:cholesterol transport system auxiliary component
MNRFLPFVIVASFLATGCATRTATPVAVYDFGLAPASTLPGQSVFVADVRSADWLETTDMYYRLAYRDSRSLARYGSNRWVGTPGAMLTVRLRQSAGNGLSAKPRQVKCTLALTLSEFSQVFDTEANSRAVMNLQATLAENIPTGRFEMRAFRMDNPTPTPDAAGGAAAFAQIADEVTRQVGEWIVESGFCKA